tara:strand:+ start:533 stop:769 length:237 start_codon:yes stop_codon:yes gene_type:complete
MRDLKNKLTSGKSTKNIQTRKSKSFGYQVLGFGAGGDLHLYVLLVEQNQLLEILKYIHLRDLEHLQLTKQEMQQDQVR